MPLLDHFHPPLSQARHWESFYSLWCGSLVYYVSEVVPKGCYAEARVSIRRSTSAPDEIEVQVYGSPTGTHLVAAIELISPGNKDRAEARSGFAGKCVSYLQKGIGLLIVDVVTDRFANLHNELIDLLGQDESYHLPEESKLYAVAYRPVRRDPDGDQIDLWIETLKVGRSLPTMPLALRGACVVPVDLEAAYSEVTRRIGL